ncbi:xanthine dehydrogenase family protein molybdopterin-binding subunit [Acidiferrimicrobium sp. IK]|uniref:xanthine dehydrogenase family protein molybdopterin-binding subunit n=1 Tax=Acidiferrimicrobium sp. IK TaxID=2871700 RepID=UPI0021CB8D70|nr:xanthine dehydrogenase family protein molybdopterin-binding subunit [Acidiferrimicrobium sp. IK]
MSILGNRVQRREDPKFLTTGGVYGDDLKIEGALWATFVRSTMAHARLTSLDVTEARNRPGVVAIYTGEDVDLPPVPAGLPGVPDVMARPVLAKGVVRFVGEAVAVVLTEERYQGEDAAESVFVDYEPLPAVVDPVSALTGDVLLFPEHGSNVAVPMNEPQAEDFFDGCEVVVRHRLINQRVAPCPLEVRSGAAMWEGDRVIQYASNQAPHGAKAAIAGLYGLEADRVRVIAPDVGGGFGAKIGLYVEDLILPWLAKAAGRPVHWTETRSESMLALGHGRAQVQDVAIGGSRDGKVEAYRLEVVQDAGAYPSLGSFLPALTRLMTSGTYDIPKVEFSAASMVTNTTPTVAYRGAGRPEATAAIERAMDLFAAEIGMDPAEVRKRNVVANDKFPFTTPTGTVYDIGDYGGAIDLALQASDYQALRAEQATRRSSGDTTQIGIGVSSYVEITNGAGPPGEYAKVEILPGGKARVYTGTSPHGQGHETAWTMLASEQLGIPMEDIEFVANDTDLVPEGGGTMGSRSLQSGGLAVHEASIALVDKAAKLAAELLEANADDVVLDKVGGRFHVAGTPAVGRSWAELAEAAGDDGDALVVAHSSSPAGPTFPFGAHVAVVEVDTDTGRVKLTRLVAVDDAGTIVNPLLAEGQRHGGLAQGAAQALMEEVRYDDDGNPVTSNLADYAMISATELPSFELVAMATPTPINALGAKGIGESGTIGSTPAVQSAVVDALAHLGVRHIDMPATPERVWRAVAAAQSTAAE